MTDNRKVMQLIFLTLLNMSLRVNSDGTYTLVRLNALRGDSLIIPELVSVIEPMALQGHSLMRVFFPKNFTSKNPIHINFLKDGCGRNLSVITSSPLDIRCDEESLNAIYNERFFNLKYRTFVSLYELYPQAFTMSENGKCMFDEGEFTKNLNMMKNVSADGTFVQVKAGNELDEVLELDGCMNIIAMELLGKKSYREEEIKTRVIPASVDTLFVDTPLDELIIEGNPHNVFLYQKPKNLKINAPLSKVNASNIVRDYKESYGEQHDNYIFNVPDLCDEDSAIPGYIRATLAFRDGVEAYDVITEINTKFIVSMSPTDITHRDHPVMGTRIHMASNGIERHQTLVVYEPMEMIAEKIAKVTTGA